MNKSNDKIRIQNSDLVRSEMEGNFFIYMSHTRVSVEAIPIL